MDGQDGAADVLVPPGEWVANQVTAASEDCIVTLTVRAPLEPNGDVVLAGIGDAVRGMEALLGFTL